jgi:hypothetical protein
VPATNLDGTLWGHPQGVNLYGLEICTPQDVDYYSFTVTSGRHAVILIDYATDRWCETGEFVWDGGVRPIDCFPDSTVELGADLLDASLAVIASGGPFTGGLRLEGTLEPQPNGGPHYLRVAAGPGGSKNAYDVSITFTEI